MEQLRWFIVGNLAEQTEKLIQALHNVKQYQGQEAKIFISAPHQLKEQYPGKLAG